MAAPIRIYRMPGFPDPSANLPKLPTPGFTDSFNRPDTQNLGQTDDGKPWIIGGPGTLGIQGGEAYGTTTQNLFGVVDTGTANGRLRVVIGSQAANNSGVVVRYVDASNYLLLNFNPGRPRFASRVDNVYTAIEDGPNNVQHMAPGDVLDVYLDGTRIRVELNNVEIMDFETTLFQTAARHGIFVNSNGTDIRFDSAQFTE